MFIKGFGLAIAVAVVCVLMLVGSQASAMPSPDSTEVKDSQDTTAPQNKANFPLLRKLGATEDLMDLVGLRSVGDDKRLTALALDSTEGSSPPLSLFILPIIAANPNSGLIVGVGGQAGYFLGASSDTRMSTTQGSVTVTTKEQTILSTQSTLYASQDDLILNLDWRYYDFSQNTFGLGSSAPEGSAVFGGSVINGVPSEDIPGMQPMLFKYTRLHQSLLFEVAQDLYVGGAIQFDFHTNIVDESLDLEADTPNVTSHYSYSTTFGFDPNKYTLAGVAVEAIFDQRDNAVSPFLGPYARASVRMNPTWMGSSQSSITAWAEYRSYLSLDDILPRNLLGFWAYIHGVVSGNVPYLDLPALGYDFSGRSGRGHLQGRFRGPALAYAETEWRFPITEGGLLGAVIFANVTSASSPSYGDEPGEKLFRRFRGAFGAGLRIMAMKYTRTMIGIDAGFSSDRQPAVYSSVGDAF